MFISKLFFQCFVGWEEEYNPWGVGLNGDGSGAKDGVDNDSAESVGKSKKTKTHLSKKEKKELDRLESEEIARAEQRVLVRQYKTACYIY